MDDFSRWIPFSPFRSPEWRWLRATYLHETGRRMDRRVDDGWVVHAREALRGRGRSNSPAAAVREAREVWGGDQDRRGEIEARLLAGETDAAVGQRVGLPAGVVAAFAEVFFCVRPALADGGSDWLRLQAVGCSPFGGFTRPLPWAAWRLAGMVGGPVLLDLVIATTLGRPLPPGGANAGGADDGHVRGMTRAWVEMAGAGTPAAFAQVVREYRRLGTAAARRRGRKADVEPVVNAMESFLLSPSVIGSTGVPAGSAGGSGRGDEPCQGASPSRTRAGDRGGRGGSPAASRPRTGGGSGRR